MISHPVPSLTSGGGRTGALEESGKLVEMYGVPRSYLPLIISKACRVAYFTYSVKDISPKDSSLKRGGAWKTVPSPKELALRSSVTVTQTEVQATAINTPNTIDSLKALSTTSENMPPYRLCLMIMRKKKNNVTFA
jgi:hypothetical protein